MNNEKQFVSSSSFQSPEHERAYRGVVLTIVFVISILILIGVVYVLTQKQAPEPSLWSQASPAQQAEATQLSHLMQQNSQSGTSINKDQVASMSKSMTSQKTGIAASTTPTATDKQRAASMSQTLNQQ